MLKITWKRDRIYSTCYCGSQAHTDEQRCSYALQPHYTPLLLLLLVVAWGSPASAQMGRIDYNYAEFDPFGEYGPEARNRTDVPVEVYGDFDGDGFWERVVGVPSREHVVVPPVPYADPYTVVDEGKIYLYNENENDRPNYCDSSHPLHNATYCNVWQMTQINNNRGSIYHEPFDVISSSDRSFTMADIAAGYGDEPGFASSLAVGDFDGDGIDDLAIGFPTATVESETNAGVVVIMFGKSDTVGTRGGFPDMAPSDFRVITQSEVGNPTEADDYFGSTLAVGDFDGDGADDLVIGVPDENWGTSYIDMGIVHLLSSAETVGTPTGYVTIPRTLPIPETVDLRASLITGGPGLDRHRYFGAALAVGRFNDAGADSLVVGAPGEDVVYSGSTRRNAGQIYAFYSQPGTDTGIVAEVADIIDQATRSVADHPQDDDWYGTRLGSIKHKIGDDELDALWVGVSRNEGHSGCITLGEYSDTYPERRYHNVLYPDMNGFLNPSSGGLSIDDDIHCSLFSPSIINYRGVFLEQNTGYGPITFYVPSGMTDIEQITIHVQGSMNDCENRTYRKAIVEQDAIYNFETVGNNLLLFPMADNQHFGNASGCMTSCRGGACDTNHMGYRGLYGGLIRNHLTDFAYDDWINLIADNIYYMDDLDLDTVAFGTEPRMNIIGHSAGGQFVSRYIFAWPERVNNAVIHSASSFLYPDTTDEWPHGMAPASEEKTQNWPDWDGPAVPDRNQPWEYVDVGTLSERWQEVADLNVLVVAGEHEDCLHLNRAYDWAMYVSDPTVLNANVDLCFTANAGHTVGEDNSAHATSYFAVTGLYASDVCVDPADVRQAGTDLANDNCEICFNGVDDGDSGFESDCSDPKCSCDAPGCDVEDSLRRPFRFIDNRCNSEPLPDPV